jgi:hypothetical protein
MPDAQRPRRPASLPFEPTAPGGPEDVPGRRSEVADRVVDALLTVGRQDPALAVRRADDLGLPQLAEAWSAAEPGSRAAVLWRLHLLRTWLRFRGPEAVAVYLAGREMAPVEAVVAGVPDVPTATDLGEVGERLLLAAYGGSFADAAERGAALLRVVASGQARLAGHDRQALAEAVRARESADVLAAGARAYRSEQPPH